MPKENRFKEIVDEVESMLIVDGHVESDTTFTTTFEENSATISMDSAKIHDSDFLAVSLDDFFASKNFSYEVIEKDNLTQIVITDKREEDSKPVPPPPEDNKPIEVDYTDAIQNIYDMAESVSSATASNFVETEGEGCRVLTLDSQLLEYGSYEEMKEMESEFQYPGFEVVISQNGTDIVFTITKC